MGIKVAICLYSENPDEIVLLWKETCLKFGSDMKEAGSSTPLHLQVQSPQLNRTFGNVCGSSVVF